MELMKHQYEAVKEIIENYQDGKNIIIYTSGVGTGKTSVFCGVAKHIEGRILYIIPKKAIIANVLNNKMFKQENLENRTDFITFNYFSDITKGKKLDEYNLIVIDEAHHIGSDTYGKNLINCLKIRNIKTLGLTATPERMDNIDVKTLFHNSVTGLTNFEAITKGLMPRIEYLVCSPEEEVDLSSVMIDWKSSYRLLKEAIQENPKNKWICFFSKIADLQAMKPYIKSIFPNYEILEVHSDSGNTQEILNKANKIDKCVMLNCDMLLEGLHFDNVDGIILFRNVHSVPVFEQIIGRVSAMFKTENPLVIDCTDTWLRMDRYIEYEKSDTTRKDGFDGFNDVIGGELFVKTPCYVSLKNKQYYDYMKYLKSKYEKSLKRFNVFYKGIEYPSKEACCKALDIKIATVKSNYRKYPEKTFEEIVDIVLANYIHFRGKRYRDWTRVCEEYGVNRDSVASYKYKHKTTFAEAIEYYMTCKNTGVSRVRWTKEEDEIIRKFYPLEASKVAERLPNRTELQSVDRARRLGVKIDPHRPFVKKQVLWTNEEVKMIKKYYPIEGTKVSRRLLDRTEEQCRYKARRLGVKYVR
jgi:hypothetical protein